MRNFKQLESKLKLMMDTAHRDAVQIMRERDLFYFQNQEEKDCMNR